MQNQTFNFLFWENPSLPIAAELLSLVEKIDFKSYNWDASGFPIDGAKYSIVGDVLYLDEMPDGTSKVTIQDFTGVAYTALFLKDSDDNKLLTFKLSFLGGVLKNIELFDKKVISSENWNSYLSTVTSNTTKILSRQSKVWYKYIYKPYGNSVRIIGWALCFLLLAARSLVLKISLFLTPWE